MGFFSKNEAPMTAGGALTPLTMQRVKEAFESESWTYRVDSDGDVASSWQQGYYFVTLQGKQQEILHVRGQWRGELTAEQYAQAVEVCNTWNTEKLWPKTYARRTDDGVRLNVELNVDFEEGVTDEQLSRQLNCVFATSESFFEEACAAAFPAEWAAADPDRENK